MKRTSLAVTHGLAAMFFFPTGAPAQFSAATSRVFQAAAKNPDGSMALVLTNPGDAKEMTVACGGQTAKVALTADSITTLRWS